jgi:hypothetical protein
MKLLQIEHKKILTYKTFWIVIGLYFIFLALGIILAEYMANSMIDDVNKRLPIPLPHAVLFTFPDIWQNLSFFASIRYVLIFPAIVVIILITNEFTFKTIRQNVICGMSKTEVLVSKLYIAFGLAFAITLILGLVMLILGLIHSDAQSLSMIFDKFVFVIGLFIQLLTFLIYAFFFAFLFRNTGLSIALFTLYALIIEPVIYFFLKAPFMFENNISTYLPVNAVIRVVEYPAIPALKKIMNLSLQESITLVSALIPLGYSALMIGIIFWVTKKRDL